MTVQTDRSIMFPNFWQVRCYGPNHIRRWFESTAITPPGVKQTADGSALEDWELWELTVLATVNGSIIQFAFTDRGLVAYRTHSMGVVAEFSDWKAVDSEAFAKAMRPKVHDMYVRLINSRRSNK